MAASQKNLCTSRQAAEYLGVTSRTVQLWADAGIVSSWKTPGGHRRYNLPEIQELAKKIQAGIPPSLASSSKPIKVLIIEDDPSLLRLYELTLKSWGLALELYLANNGYSGLLKIGQIEPDLLILDINLPNINGLSIVNSLSESNLLDCMELLVVTGLDIDHVRTALPKNLEKIILSKPVSFDYIKSKLKKIIATKKNS